MLAAQVVSVFPGCGQTAFAGRNLNVHSHDLRPLDPGKIHWGVLKHIRDGIIKRQCTVVSARRDIHNGLIHMGFNAILVYPHSKLLQSDSDDLMKYLESFQGQKIRLRGDQTLSDVIEHDRDNQLLRVKES